MQWKDDVSNDDIEAVNASSTTKIQYSSTSSEAYKPHIMHVIEKGRKRQGENGRSIRWMVKENLKVKPS